MAELVPVLTIDGLSGAGKGTLSQQLAAQLHWHWLDSGALYRVLAFSALRQGIAAEDEAGLQQLAGQLDVQFYWLESEGTAQIRIHGEEVSAAIRDPACGEVASRIAVLPGVRQALLARQRQFRQPPGLIADGRDMGSVVFPDAGLKIFLTANLATRSRRRQAQLHEKGISVSLERISAELTQRDQRDMQRAIAPLQPAPDAWIIDTSVLSIAELSAMVMAEVRKRF